MGSKDKFSSSNPLSVGVLLATCFLTPASGETNVIEIIVDSDPCLSSQSSFWLLAGERSEVFIILVFVGPCSGSVCDCPPAAFRARFSFGDIADYDCCIFWRPIRRKQDLPYAQKSRGSPSQFVPCLGPRESRAKREIKKSLNRSEVKSVISTDEVKI